MRLNDDGKTVTAMDVLVPGIGEVIGGAQREERLEQLAENMKFHKLNAGGLLVVCRTCGNTAPCRTPGFGLGFERLLMFLTGVVEHPRRDSLRPHAGERGVLISPAGRVPRVSNRETR